MPGSAKCSPGVRSSPRSSPTTESPALVSSRAMMLPVQPMPTMTASTAFSFLGAMTVLSRKIGDGLWFDGHLLAAQGFGFRAPGGGQPGITEHAPGDLVAIAAIHWIGEKAFHRRLQQRFEEGLRFEPLELSLSCFHRCQRLRTVGWRKAIKGLPVGFHRPRIRSPDAGREIFARRKRKLVAMLGFARQERSVAIELGPIAPGARKLPVDIGDTAAIGARRGQIVRGNYGVVGCREEGRFIRRQRQER